MMLLLILCVTFLCPTLGVKTKSSPDNVVEIEPEEEIDSKIESMEPSSSKEPNLKKTGNKEKFENQQVKTSAAKTKEKKITWKRQSQERK
jgi:hypothetical protein